MSSAQTGPFSKVRNALAWRIRRVLGDARVDHAIVTAAKKWRPFLSKPVFIAVTGSAGKTTTKELLVGMLSYHQEGVGTQHSLNALPEVAKLVLRIRREHDYCVAEISEDHPGALDPVLSLLEPSIGIVTVIKDDHLAAFTSRGALVAEMAKMVASLPATGTAILNADDENVLSMRAQCKARVITYGTASTADLRAENVSSAWPERLQMTLVHDSMRVRVVTQLCGIHWVPAVLGAIGGALATGLTLQECASAIATVEPFEARMQPVTSSDGVTFIRDDFKAPLWTLNACFDFVKAARAPQKIVVIGELSDVGPQKSKAYARAAGALHGVADVSVFVGPWASGALKAQKRGKEGSLHVFNHVQDASAYINSIAKDGDLVLLKGTSKKDHLLRIIMARSNEIACWRDDCDRLMFCDACSYRMRPLGEPVPRDSTVPSIVATIPKTSKHIALDPSEQVIIGLGNPGERFDNTPHNVGYAVVDRIAASMLLDWNTLPNACIARGTYEGHAVCLVKILTPMNLIGTELKVLSENMSFQPQQCLLVFDDLDLPFGTIRMRKIGSAGGHRGVASILEAFQSGAFKRVKLGVASPNSNVNRADYVLQPFAQDVLPALNRLILDACLAILAMLQESASDRAKL